MDAFWLGFLIGGMAVLSAIGLLALIVNVVVSSNGDDW